MEDRDEVMGREIEKEVESKIALYYRLLRYLRKYDIPKGLSESEFQALKQAYADADEKKVKAFYHDEGLAKLRQIAAEKGIEYASILPKETLLDRISNTAKNTT